MSSKIKKWSFGKFLISNGASCSGCKKPNLVDIIEPKPKIPIYHTKPSSSTSICHTSSSSGVINGVGFMDDDGFDQDDHTSTTFSIDISSLSPPSSDQNDNVNLSLTEGYSGSKVSTCSRIDGGTLEVVENLNSDSFRDNRTPTTAFSIVNIYSLSPPSSDQNDSTNLSLANSGSKVDTCQKIGERGTLEVVENLNNPFHDDHAPTTYSIVNIDSLSPPNSNQNDDVSLSHSETNSESKVKSSPHLDGPFFQDNHTSTTFSINTKSLSPPRSDHQNERTNLSPSEANSEFKVDSCPKISSSTLAVVVNSDDPFQDFKKSMLQMIFEKEIHSPEDLEQLLNCFLQLNSPSHHYTIIQAFMEILNNGKVVSEGPETGLFPSPSESPKVSRPWK